MNMLSKIVVIASVTVLMAAVDPNDAGTLGGFTTATSTVGSYQPIVIWYSDGICSQVHASYLFNNGAISFDSNEVNPENWYLTGTGLANYASLANPAINVSSIAAIKFMDGVSCTISPCIGVTPANGSFTRSSGSGTAASVVDLESSNTNSGSTKFKTQKLYSHVAENISAIATNGEDVYYLVKSSTGTGVNTVLNTVLKKIDQNGTITFPITLPTGNTYSYPGMTIAGNYLYILQQYTGSPATFKVFQYDLSNFASTSMTLSSSPLSISTAKAIISDGNANLYILGTVASKGLIFIPSTFDSATIYKLATSHLYTSITFRNSSSTSGKSYIYGTYLSGSSPVIDEIDISSLSTAVPPTNVNAISFIPSTSSINKPNLIMWVPVSSMFVISDSDNNGSDSSDGTTNGALYSYTPAFDSTSGAISTTDTRTNGVSFGSGTLIIRGNANSGTNYTEIISTTSINDGMWSTSCSQYVYQTNSLAWGLSSSSYLNLYMGNGNSGAATAVIGNLIKFCISGGDSCVSGMSDSQEGRMTPLLLTTAESSQKNSGAGELGY